MEMKKWTQEQISYLKEISPGKLNQQIADMINKKFGTSYTKTSIQTKKTKLGIISKPDWRTVWTDEVIQFMIENYEGRDNIELAELLNEKFNLNTNGDRVCNVKSNLIRRKGINLRTGINRGCIQKGNIPMNKGKKWDEYMSKEGQMNSRKTCFKKGQVPINHREVGSERINVDGYWEIKVAEPNIWKLKHRVIYEKEHGEIPKGSKIIFADGNKNNLDPSNLISVSYAEELHLNKRGLRFQDKELTETGLNIVKLVLKAGEKKR